MSVSQPALPENITQKTNMLQPPLPRKIICPSRGTVEGACIIIRIRTFKVGRINNFI